ncbi:MAG: glycosyltransferase [Schwartzia sp.]|nr:glycosyltransferase [Schwartzia sp. (in: firmicutes)]
MTPKGGLMISLCYIVKNEAAVLERSLLSAEKAADEIVVVDTGSTDDTMKIARAHGARVFSYAWKEHFSDARNFALEKATGDWVVFLDADEYFTKDTKKNIRNVIEKADRKGILLLALQWKNYDSDTGAHLVDIYTPRIFKNLPTLRYVGRIHEQLMENGEIIERVEFVPEDELCLIHTGYSSHLSKEKAERNLRLLKLDLKESKHPEQLYMALAEAYEGVGDIENAVRYAEMDIERGRQAQTYGSRSYRILINLLRGKGERHRRILEKAVNDFPELPEFHAELAESLGGAGDYEGAVREAELGLYSYRNYHSIEPMQFDEQMANILESRCALWKDKISCGEQSPEIKISACVIVKNEEKDLPLWLENAKKYADEIIVVDTGSADATKEIAKSAGAAVYEISWKNDFSAAKNTAIEKASGDWIAFLDADETFFNPEIVPTELKNILKHHPETEALRVTIVNVDEDDRDREIQRFRTVRIFKREKNIRYQNPVHEVLVKTDGSEPVTLDAESLSVRHTGYSTGRISEKHRRNLALLYADIEKNGERPQHYRYLAACFLGMGFFGKALHYGLKAIESPMKSKDSESELYRIVLQSLAMLKYPLSERIDRARRAAEKFPELPDFHMALGLLLLKEGKSEEAEKELREALRLAECMHIESSAFADSEDELCRGLAEIARRKGERDMEMQELKKALAINPNNEAALEAFADTFTDDREAAEKLEETVGNSEEDLRFLARWAEHHGRISLYRIFAEKLKSVVGKELPRAELYDAVETVSPEELRNRIASGLVGNFSRLILTLIRLEKTDTPSAAVMRITAENLLPPVAVGMWRAYTGRADSFEDEGFAPFLPWFINYADDEQLVRFASLGIGISEACLYDSAKQVMGAARWQPAFELLAQLPQESPIVSAEFWKNVGICLYHIGDADAAKESLGRALSMGDKSKELEAYLEWAEEAAGK